MRCFLWMGAAATAAVMVCVGAGCGGSTFTSGADAGGDGSGSSGSSSGSASSSGGGSGGSSGGGSGGSSGGGSSSSSGGATSPCPSSQPSNGMACTHNGVQCEYGTSPDPACNQLFDCLNGTWAGGGTGGICPVGTCPPNYADVHQGQTCTPNGLDCAYLAGQCNCTFSLPAGGTGPTWHCFHPQGCPEPRPRLGSACAQQGQSCDYGACTGGLLETCNGGYWQWTMTPCPG